MTHQYFVEGMTCDACAATVKRLLEKVPGVTLVSIDLNLNTAEVSMNSHIQTAALQEALKNHPKYQITDKPHAAKPVAAVPAPTPALPDETRSFWQTYKPVLLVFGYILGATLAVEAGHGGFSLMRWMEHFMAGFFLVFSFFKLLDVPAFAMSYSSYDLVARKWNGWGYIYPFIELTLGFLFLISFNHLITNAVTLVVMGVSTLGVVNSLMAKRRFQCACLGTVFNLPMSTITLVEDLLMVGMSAAMLLI